MRHLMLLMLPRTRRARIWLLATIAVLLALSLLLFMSDSDASVDAWTAVMRYLPAHVYLPGSPYCRRVHRLIASSVEKWVARSDDPELRALYTPLFTQRRLVIWSADLHVALVADLKSLLGPLGVEFVDRGLAHPNHCARLCECGGRRSLKVLNMDNAHGPSADTVREFHRAYVGSEEMQRVDAFFFSFPIANFEHFRVFNRSLIIVSPTRYEDMRFDTAQWTALNANLQTLARNNTRHVLAANNQYDAEYIRYFTGLAVDYVQSFCAYPSVSYAPSPTRNAFLLSALRDSLKDKLARLWDEEFTREYKRIGASFELVSKQRKYLYEDLVVFRGIVHVPYQVSIMSILEQYRMNVPLFFPSLELLVDWQFEHWLMTERTWEGVGLKRPRGSYMRAHATQRERPDPNNEWDRRALHYWLKFADFYTLPHIEHFHNVTHLVQLLAQSTAPHLHAISRQMHAHNERVLKQLLIYWRRKLLDIAASSPNRPH